MEWGSYSTNQSESFTTSSDIVLSYNAGGQSYLYGILVYSKEIYNFVSFFSGSDLNEYDYTIKNIHENIYNYSPSSIDIDPSNILIFNNANGVAPEFLPDGQFTIFGATWDSPSTFPVSFYLYWEAINLTIEDYAVFFVQDSAGNIVYSKGFQAGSLPVNPPDNPPVVPLPGTALLLGSGLMALAFLSRRLRRR